MYILAKKEALVLQKAKGHGLDFCQKQRFSNIIIFARKQGYRLAFWAEILGNPVVLPKIEG